MAKNDDFHNLIKQYEIPLLVYALKRITDIDHAISCEKLSEYLNGLLLTESGTDYFNGKTTSRKMKIIDDIASNGNDSLKVLNNVFQASFGGKIKAREADGIYKKTTAQGKGTQKRYYFEPLLTSSDMELIYGSLRSNRFLSEEEKDFLSSRLNVLTPCFGMTEAMKNQERNQGFYDINSLPDRPKTDPRAMRPNAIPGSNSTLLRNAHIIYEAIENKTQIEVIYGIYDLSSETNKIEFHVRNKDAKGYILNPYGLIWNNGEYYLIASHEGHDSEPTHFRVDRIISVKVHTALDENYEMHATKRAEIPESLREFYQKGSNGKIYFDGIRYANTHPLMAIHKSTKLTSCTFECTNWSLQMLIDTFGPDIQIAKSNLAHEDSEVDYNGKPQEFLLATIANVQYDNAKRFAIQHCQYLTLVSPSKMVAEVKDTLEQAIAKLGK